MYSGNPYQLQQALEELARRDRERNQSASHAALRLYRRICRQGWQGWLWSALSGRESHLLDLRQVEAQHRIDNRCDVGCRTVALHLIRGSEGRCREFDGGFRPLQSHGVTRWLAIATARKMGLALPPVELIRVGDIYFVRDGHHRVSVARAMGQAEIEAEVTVWHVTGALDPCLLHPAAVNRATWLAHWLRPSLGRLSLPLVTLGGRMLARGLPPYLPGPGARSDGQPGTLVP